MRLQILLTIAMLFCLSFGLFAQTPNEIPVPESTKPTETYLLDEFGKLSDCEFGARIQNLYVELGNLQNSTGYIIIYRGADALPSAQTTKTFEKQSKRIRWQQAVLKLDESQVVVIDGGFRDSSSLFSQVFIVPEGAIPPKPTETVEKTKTPTDKAFKVAENLFENQEALIKKEEIPEELEQTDEEVSETEETPETENPEIETSENPNDDIFEDFYENTDPFWWFSEYFAERLIDEKDAQGVIIFYTDEAEYDIAKTHEIIKTGLQKKAEELKFDHSKVNILFGGYRELSSAEYWIVPKGAKNPEPKPETKKISKTEEN